MNLNKAIERRKYLLKWNKNRRRKLRAEHKCICCKKKVKPVTTYPQFCEEHNPTNRKKRLKEVIKNETT